MKKKRHCSKKVVNMLSKMSQHTFSVIMYLIEAIYRLLATNSSATKREIYYKNADFFVTQNAVSTALNDICLMLGAYPWELNIHSSTKGIMVGAIVLIAPDNQEIDFSLHMSGTVLPSNVTDIKGIRTTAKFLLIVEKDTVFKRLVQDGIFEKLGSDMILITARGFPDVSTRWLVKKIWDDFRMPSFALVDADPYGIEILCCYKYGSMVW